MQFFRLYPDRSPTFLFAAKRSRSPFSGGSTKLLQLAEAALTRNAVDFDLQISVVLKGARGTGKMTAITYVAGKLGLHVLEVRHVL